MSLLLLGREQAPAGNSLLKIVSLDHLVGITLAGERGRLVVAVALAAVVVAVRVLRHLATLARRSKLLLVQPSFHQRVLVSELTCLVEKWPEEVELIIIDNIKMPSCEHFC